MTSLVNVVKVQSLGARRRSSRDQSHFSAVSAPWRLLPATEPTQLGRSMNAYKYQKFLEGLNNLRGITNLLAPCLLSLPIVRALTVVYCMGSLLFINPLPASLLSFLPTFILLFFLLLFSGLFMSFNGSSFFPKAKEKK